MLVNSVIDLIGNTPLVKINNIDTFGNEIYIKLEGSNPGRSTKDRIALKMIEEGEKAGLIDKNTVIMEATSGNTGIGLAMICAVKNYKLKIVMPDTMSVERIQLMRAYGTEVIFLRPMAAIVPRTVATAAAIMAIISVFFSASIIMRSSRPVPGKEQARLGAKERRSNVQHSFRWVKSSKLQKNRIFTT